MEDAATAEISRTQIWQWLKFKIYLNNGKQFDVTTSISGNACTVTITPDAQIQKDIAYIIVQGDA